MNIQSIKCWACHILESLLFTCHTQLLHFLSLSEKEYFYLRSFPFILTSVPPLCSYSYSMIGSHFLPNSPPPPMPSPEAPRLRQGLSVCHRGFLLCSFFLLSISLVVLSPFLLLYLGPISECFCSLSCFTQQPVKAVIGLWCNKANTHGGHSPGAFKGRIMVLRIQSSDLPPRAKSCYCVSRCGLVWWGECPLEESSSRMLKDLLVF